MSATRAHDFQHDPLIGLSATMSRQLPDGARLSNIVPTFDVLDKLAKEATNTARLEKLAAIDLQDQANGALDRVPSMFKLLKRVFGESPPTAVGADPLLSALVEAYPAGPLRRGSLCGVQRGHDLTNRAPVVSEILIFDARTHWVYVFAGCGALGLPFELSFRTSKKSANDTPPDWPIEPITRVANAIGDGADCALGVTWRIGPSAIPSFAGLVTLRDIEFGSLEPTPLYQLVPITAEELELKGDALRALFDRLYGTESRMIGVAAEA